MELYLDILLIENMIINLFLLLITFKGLRYRYKGYKIYLAAGIGSIYTIVIFYDNPFLNSMFVKTIVAIVMITIAIKDKHIKKILKATVAFYLFSFMFAGMCFSIITMQNTYSIGTDFIVEKNSIKWIVIALLMFFIIIIRVVDLLKERAVVNNFLYDICIKYGKNTLFLKAFLDTGNELREPITNWPCIIVEEKYLKDIKLSEDQSFIINFKTISDNGKILGYKAEEVKIKNHTDRNWREVNAILCSSQNKLSEENEYQALLSRGII